MEIIITANIANELSQIIKSCKNLISDSTDTRIFIPARKMLEETYSLLESSNFTYQDVNGKVTKKIKDKNKQIYYSDVLYCRHCLTEFDYHKNENEVCPECSADQWALRGKNQTLK